MSHRSPKLTVRFGVTRQRSCANMLPAYIDSSRLYDPKSRYVPVDGSSGRPPPPMFTPETRPVSVAYRPSADDCCEVVNPAALNALENGLRIGSFPVIPMLVIG